MKGFIAIIFLVAVIVYFSIQYIDFPQYDATSSESKSQQQDSTPAESQKEQTKISLSELRNRLERVEQKIAKEKEEKQEIIREEMLDDDLEPVFDRLKPYKERIKELEKERSKVVQKIENRTWN